MKSNLLLVAAAVAVLLAASSHQQAQQSNKCMEDFSNAFSKCVQSAGGGVTIENVLWFVTNGTSSRSQAPANPDSFKTQVCGVQQQIGACTFQSMGAIINSTACVGTSASTNQQAAVSNQLTTIFGTFDIKCMHPCRTSLPNDLRSCYSENKLDPSLFLSNSSNGAVIGSTQDQVTVFCGAKDALIKCLQSKVNACPEAPQILRSIDLDIPSLQKGVTVLCNHPDVYLHGLKCFNETTPDIERCKQKDMQSMMQLDSQARAGNWSEQKFNQEMCQFSLAQIECDNGAWRKKKHEACTDAVIGLRLELECELIPDQCSVEPKQISQVEHVCHPGKFDIKSRNEFAKGAQTSTSTWVKAGTLLTGVGLVTSMVV
ncbi:hypothetical protein BsWGS_26782 [Bradybaena similaris]